MKLIIAVLMVVGFVQFAHAEEESDLACEAIMCLTANDHSEQCRAAQSKHCKLICTANVAAGRDNLRKFLNECTNSGDENTAKLIEKIVARDDVGACGCSGGYRQ